MAGLWLPRGSGGPSEGRGAPPYQTCGEQGCAWVTSCLCICNALPGPWPASHFSPRNISVKINRVRSKMGLKRLQSSGSEGLSRWKQGGAWTREAAEQQLGW